MQRAKNKVAYLFISPWIIGFVLFTGGPIIAVFLLSFCKWDMISTPKWVGFSNYVKMFQSGSEFWTVLEFTLLYTLLSVLISVSWALLLALLVNQKVKGTRFFGFLYFVPAVVPIIALTFAFQLIFNKELGIVNYLLALIGVKNPPNWLMDPSYVRWLLAVLNIYTFYTGQMMLIFDSALKEVPKELYEAAEIDGAGVFTRFLRITLPAISPILLFNLVTATVNSLSMSFALIYPLTGGGPGKLTQAISLDIYYNAFKTFRLGYASAEAVILFIITAIVSLLMFILSKEWVYYEV